MLFIIIFLSEFIFNTVRNNNFNIVNIFVNIMKFSSLILHQIRGLALCLSIHICILLLGHVLLGLAVSWSINILRLLTHCVVAGILGWLWLVLLRLILFLLLTSISTLWLHLGLVIGISWIISSKMLNIFLFLLNINDGLSFFHSFFISEASI